MVAVTKPSRGSEPQPTRLTHVPNATVKINNRFMLIPQDKWLAFPGKPRCMITNLAQSIKSERGLLRQLHDMPYAADLHSARHVECRRSAVHKLRQSAPRREIHLPHRPTFALPNQTEDVASCCLGRLGQAVNPQDNHVAG